MATAIKPLPYIYNSEDERITAILKQIKDFCGIDETQDHLPTEPKDLWPIIWQVLRLLSNVTCWDDNPEDLFLTQWRLQTYDTKTKCGCSANCCDCDDNYLIIPLEYAPYSVLDDEPFISGSISAIFNGEYKSVDITAEYLNAHLNKARNKLYIPRTDFADMLMDGSCCCCLCQRDITVELLYNAGYDTIPMGLLPIICSLLNKVNSGIDDTDCHDNMTQTSGLLKRKKVGNVEYEWSTTDTTTSKTATLYSDIHDIAVLDEVLAISRCYLNNQKEELGDVV